MKSPSQALIVVTLASFAASFAACIGAVVSAVGWPLSQYNLQFAIDFGFWLGWLTTALVGIGILATPPKYWMVVAALGGILVLLGMGAFVFALAASWANC